MRCACCDKQMKSSEIIWYPEQNRHEDMCKKCRQDVFKDLLEEGFNVERIGYYQDDIDE